MKKKKKAGPFRGYKKDFLLDLHKDLRRLAQWLVAAKNSEPCLIIT